MKLSFIAFLLVFIHCSFSNPSKTKKRDSSNTSNSITANSILDTIEYLDIAKRMEEKINSKTPLIVHLFVPLCDNKHQGIVPVNSSLGDGTNLRTNLYWGAGYGIKTFFSRSKTWKSKDNILFKDSFLMERVVFEKTYSNGAKVILIADAYNGAFMSKCLVDYYNALAGINQDSIYIDSTWLNINKNADLIAFNGHNGNMDAVVEKPISPNQIPKATMAIACVSKPYFRKYFIAAQAYPLLTTNHVLAPEAYVFSAALDAWALQKSPSQIHVAAANAYNQYQKCGINGAKRIFNAGW